MITDDTKKLIQIISIKGDELNVQSVFCMLAFTMGVIISILLLHTNFGQGLVRNFTGAITLMVGKGY